MRAIMDHGLDLIGICYCIPLLKHELSHLIIALSLLSVVSTVMAVVYTVSAVARSQQPR